MVYTLRMAATVFRLGLVCKEKKKWEERKRRTNELNDWLKQSVTDLI